MPEQPDQGLHRNRKFSLPFCGDGPANCFSVNDVLTGKTPVRFGSGQHANIFTQEEVPADTNPPNTPTPNLWPQLWPQAGRLLRVPRVVILSDYICWPEFWEQCVFDYPRDVIGIFFTDGHLSTYYYLDQWNVDADWKDPAKMTGDGDISYRYSTVINNGTVANPYYAQHKALYDSFRRIKTRLESQDDPIYVVLPNWIPKLTYETATKRTWTQWQNDNIYWDPNSGQQAQTDVIHGHTNCDIFSTGGNRGRTKPDVNCPYWRSDSDNPPSVPFLSCPTPYFGTNVLHLWIGHFCINWGGSQLNAFETYPLSPAGQQFTFFTDGNYLGSATDAEDGRRLIWRDAGFNYGYMGGYKPLVDHYSSQIVAAYNTYKENFWKYRNFGVRILPWTGTWNFNWTPEQLGPHDQKPCAAGQFYDGFTFAEFAASFEGTSCYAVDYAAETNGVAFANVICRTPDDPTMHQAVLDFRLLKNRVEAYYNGVGGGTGISDGTEAFFKEVINRNNMNDFNIAWEDQNPIDVEDDLVAYINDYFDQFPS